MNSAIGNYLRTWALSVVFLWGPLFPPATAVNTIDRHWFDVYISQFPGAGWSAIEARIRKAGIEQDYTYCGMRPWPNYVFSFWTEGNLDTDTLYEIQFRSFQASTSRYSDWVTEYAHTLQ